MNKIYLKWYLLAIVFLLLFIAYYADVLIGNKQRAAQTSVANELVATIEKRLYGDLDYLKLLADMRVRGEIVPSSFEERSQDFLQAHPELINLTWVDQDLYIRGVSPLQGNQQIVGLHLDLEEPARVSALAKQTRQAQYTQAFEALQGGCSFEVWYPVYKEDHFRGLFAAVYSCQALLESVLVGSVRAKYQISFSDTQNSFLAEVSRSEVDASDDVLRKPLNIKNNLVLVVTRLKSQFGDVNLYILSIAVILLITLAGLSGLRLRKDMQKRNALMQHLESSNQSLLESEKRFKLLFDSSPVGMLLLDSQGNIVDVNQFICQLFSFSKVQLLNESVQVFDTDELSVHWSELKQAKHYNTPKYMNNVKARTSGGREVSMSLALITLIENAQQFTLVCVVDDTERLELMEQLQVQNYKLNQGNQKLNHSNTKLMQSNQQLERFAYICSHDLQEPVRMVQSFGPLLAETLADKLDQKSSEYLSYMVDGADRAKDMIDDILEFCRHDQPITHYEQVALSDICQQVRDTLQLQIEGSRGELVWDLHLPTLPGVPSQLFQLMLNLVSNGLKFNHSDQPLIKVSATADDSQWYIHVSDNGIGIAEQYQTKIFSIFERLHGNSEYPGTGIGLASCQRIVERHNGSISVKSDLEQGSTFCISWPKRPQ